MLQKENQPAFVQCLISDVNQDTINLSMQEIDLSLLHMNELARKKCNFATLGTLTI